MACVNGFCTNQGCDNCVAKYTAPCGGNATNFGSAVVAGVTDIAASHVSAMRNALDAEWNRRPTGVNCTLGTLPWTNPVPGDDILASELNDLKLCNNNLIYWSGDGDTIDLIIDDYIAGNLITAVGINNMRAAINANEVRCTCDSDCGSDDCFCSCFGDCGACNYP